MNWVLVFVVNTSWTCVLLKDVVSVTNIFNVWSVLEIKVIFEPTLIWGGVKGIVIYSNSNGFILILITSDGVTIGLTITTISTTIIITSKKRGMGCRLAPPLIGLVGLVITTCCSPWFSNPKVDDDVAPIAFVLDSN